MKKITIILITCLLSTNVFTQNDSIILLVDTCKPWKNLQIEDVYRCEIDTNWEQLVIKHIPDDDTSLYPNYRTTNKTEYHELRLVYFLHGLGGSRASWSAVHDAHDQEFRYYPYRLDYAQGWGSGGSSQRDFKLASSETQKDLDNGRSNFLDHLDEDGIEYGLPYLIAHSQGGLIARDLDMKYETGYDALFLPSNRRFHGFITVGTPNAGALIAINQSALDAFSADMASRLTKPFVVNSAVNLALEIPFYSKHRTNIVTNAKDLVDDIADFLGNTLLAQITKEKRDPITNQYGPNSSYLNNELNHSTAGIPKAAFYGIEEDPIFWRIATFMIGKDASEYPLWGANEDSELGENMEDLKLKFLMEEVKAQIEINKVKGKMGKRWRLGFIGMKKLNQDLKLHTKVKDAFNEGFEFLNKANLSYKAIIGTVDLNNLYEEEIVGWRCVKREMVVETRGGPPTLKTYTTIISNPNNCDGEVYPIKKKVIKEIPSDATVPVPSQMALPGTESRFIREINEILDHANPNWNNVIYKSNVNHIQMRNCDQTHAMLRRIYEGYGVPGFFRLERY